MCALPLVIWCGVYLRVLLSVSWWSLRCSVRRDLASLRPSRMRQAVHATAQIRLVKWCVRVVFVEYVKVATPRVGWFDLF